MPTGQGLAPNPTLAGETFKLFHQRKWTGDAALGVVRGKGFKRRVAKKPMSAKVPPMSRAMLHASKGVNMDLIVEEKYQRRTA